MSVFSEKVDGSNNDTSSGGLKSFIQKKSKSIVLKVAGVLIFLGLWQLGGQWVANNPDTQNFADFAPEPTIKALSDLFLK